jgi:hypothetical protein
MSRRCIAALIALIGVTISVAALAADESRAKMMQAAALAVRLVIDNERVTVWDTTGELPAAAHDFVAIPAMPSSVTPATRSVRQGHAP